MKLILAAMLAFFPLLAYAYTRQAGQGGELAPAFSGDGFRVEPDAAPDELPAPSFLESIGLALMAATRGERNNNPGNIRISAAPWQGKVSGVDSAFETFADPQAGIRALAVLLRNYQSKHGLRSVREIITRYAPASENNTAASVRAVASAVGVGVDDPLNLQDDSQLALLVAAIIAHENGRNIYATADIVAAVSAA